MTESEVNKLADDMLALCMKIPELQGFVAVIQVVLNLTKTAIPLVFGGDTVAVEPQKMAAVRDILPPEEDIRRALNGAILFSMVAEKLAEVKKDEIGSEIVLSTKPSDFDGEDWFNNQQRFAS